MQTNFLETRRTVLIAAAVTVALSTATGLAFAAWAEQSAEIFLTLTQSGLNWCL